MAHFKPQHTPQLNTLPLDLRKTASEIMNAAKQQGGKGFRQREHEKRMMIEESMYELAKEAETMERDLRKALRFYSLSAKRGQKVDSCIKDYASVLHQLGYTQEAITILEHLEHFYQGDLKRYQRLKFTLIKQLKPSIKHQCKSLLVQLPLMGNVSNELLESMFSNLSRIKTTRVHNSLSFNQSPDEQGKWLILQFQSFSAAKKTLEKFKYEEWFGLNKYWLKGNLIVCQANDGRSDFQQCWIGDCELYAQESCTEWNQKALRMIEGEIANRMLNQEIRDEMQ